MYDCRILLAEAFQHLTLRINRHYAPSRKTPPVTMCPCFPSIPYLPRAGCRCPPQNRASCQEPPRGPGAWGVLRLHRGRVTTGKTVAPPGCFLSLLFLLSYQIFSCHFLCKCCCDLEFLKITAVGSSFVKILCENNVFYAIRMVIIPR